MLLLDRERLITAAILIGLFGGLVGGPIVSLIDYYGDPERRFWMFMGPEIIGFICVGLMIYYGKSSKKNAAKATGVA